MAPIVMARRAVTVKSKLIGGNTSHYRTWPKSPGPDCPPGSLSDADAVSYTRVVRMAHFPMVLTTTNVLDVRHPLGVWERAEARNL